MIIISIDVGIKNLAYCVFKVTNKNSYEILDWDCIDLCNLNKNKCSANCSNNKPCLNLAKYSRDNVFYCKTHAKKVNNYLIPSNELLNYKSKNKNKNLADLYKFADKFNIEYDKPSTKTKIYTLIEQFIKDKCFNLVKDVKSNDFSLVDIGKNMNTSFDHLFSKFKINQVLIENQISPIANRMKTIQGMIAQYFIMKGVDEIDFISSSNKLKYFIKSRKRTTYNERKKISIETTLKLINLNDTFKSWDDKFNHSKKKDDLSDAFLQCIWFLLNLNKVNLELPPKI